MSAVYFRNNKEGFNQLSYGKLLNGQFLKAITLFLVLFKVLILNLADSKNQIKAFGILRLLPGDIIIDPEQIKGDQRQPTSSDLLLLLQLAKTGLRDMHPVFALCLQVWGRPLEFWNLITNIQASKMAHSAGEKYIIVLKGLVSWGKKEASDDKLDKIFKNLHHGAKSSFR